MAIEQDRDVGPDVLAHEGELGGLEVGGFGGLGVLVVLAIGGRRAGPELERAEAERQVEVDLGGQLVVRIDAPAAGRIAEQAVVLRAAEQGVDRLAEFAAAQVPQGRLDPGQGREPEPGPGPEPAAVETAGGEGGTSSTFCPSRIGL